MPPFYEIITGIVYGEHVSSKRFKHTVRLEVGLILTSILFGVMNLAWGSVLEVFFTTSAGLVSGYLYHKTGSLIAPIVAHGADNTVLVTVMPYILPGYLY